MPLPALSLLATAPAPDPAVGLWLLLAIALAVSALGFLRVVYFVSVGYTFAIVGMVLASLFLWREQLSWANWLQNLALGVWGLRLGLYILARERRPAYRREQEANRERAGGLGWGRKAGIWLAVSLLYVCMFAPSWFALAGGGRPATFGGRLAQGLGAAILLGGVLIEGLADAQKSAFKARHPDRFCDQGLYRWVRCPNYCGEIMVWLGSWLMGLPFFAGALAWATGLVGLVCIVLIMMGSTKRLEQTQEARYGHLPAYQAYVRRVPVLFPWLPIYSLRGVRVYLE